MKTASPAKTASASAHAGCSEGHVHERRLFYGCFAILGATLGISHFVALPVLLQMMIYTFPILYVGSHASLKQNEVDEITGEKTNKGEAMNHTDAMLFPVFGSIALCTLYVAYKFLDASWVNFLLTLYLTAIGFIALAETLNTALHPVFPSWACDTSKISFCLRLPHIPVLCPRPDISTPEKRAAYDASCMYNFSYGQLFSYLLAILLSGLWLWKKNWAIHNLLAIAFCIQAIGLVSVGNFTVATILLSGLFIYDIFWVFGTDVMVTVAKSFEGPAKLIFPVRLDPWQQSILGLGDIVIPGVFISMCLRFDYWLASGHSSSTHEEGAVAPEVKKSSPRPTPASNIDIHQKFGKFYFWVVVVFYEIGLITTGIVMLVFQHPQPALLYLVPFCVFSLFGAAALNGQVKEVLTYREDEEEAKAVEGGEGETAGANATKKEKEEVKKTK